MDINGWAWQGFELVVDDRGIDQGRDLDVVYVCNSNTLRNVRCFFIGACIEDLYDYILPSQFNWIWIVDVEHIE